MAEGEQTSSPYYTATQYLLQVHLRDCKCAQAAVLFGLIERGFAQSRSKLSYNSTNKLFLAKTNRKATWTFVGYLATALHQLLATDILSSPTVLSYATDWNKQTHTIQTTSRGMIEGPPPHLLQHKTSV